MEKDILKFNSTLPLTHDITVRPQNLSNDISDRIYEQKTQNWRSFITLNHKTGTSKLYKTLKSITQSNTGITTSHAAIGASNRIPTYKALANILIDHYANISNTGITTSHAAIGASNRIPTYKALANILIDHYANISHMKPLQSDRRMIRHRLSYPIDHT